MHQMFDRATTFNADISGWDVSKVTDFDKMFLYATSFKRALCGAAWLKSKGNSKTTQVEMFKGSPGAIALCTTTTTTTTTTKPTTTTAPTPPPPLLNHDDIVAAKCT